MLTLGQKKICLIHVFALGSQATSGHCLLRTRILRPQVPGLLLLPSLTQTPPALLAVKWDIVFPSFAQILIQYENTFFPLPMCLRSLVSFLLSIRWMPPTRQSKLMRTLETLDWLVAIQCHALWTRRVKIQEIFHHPRKSLDLYLYPRRKDALGTL